LKEHVGRRFTNFSLWRLFVPVEVNARSFAFSFSDSRLLDLVADNTDKFDITESETLLIGKDFGIGTDIETGPNGNVFVVSNTNGAVYEITGTSRRSSSQP